VTRREFIALLGGVAVACPLAARAQQGRLPTIGFLHGGFSESNEHRITAFRKGLNETGYIDGENVAIEFRWAHDQTGRLPELAADLVRRQVAVIVTPGSTTSTHAAKAATSTIPIVFGMGGDPVNEGLVQSLARPGGNITGVAS
jgi:putative ABC transport system substrate-binding protein